GALRKLDSRDGTFAGYRMPNMTRYFETSRMLEDSSGDLWFGTFRGGIYRYRMDRDEMVSYDLMALGMAGNSVTALAEDGSGRIWIGTFAGEIALFENEKMRVINGKNGFRDADKVSDIIEDREGNILISDHKSGLSIYKGDAFMSLGSSESMDDINIKAIAADRSGALWLGTDAGLYRFRPGTDAGPVVFSRESSAGLKKISAIRETEPGKIWIAFGDSENESRIVMYNSARQAFEVNDDINNALYNRGNITALERDSRNNLWIATNNGVIICDFESGTLINKNSMGGIVQQVKALHCDRSGNMWIGTESIGGQTGGIIKYTPAGKDYSDEDFLPAEELRGIIATSIATDGSGTLWIGTGERLISFNAEKFEESYSRDNGLLSDKINLVIPADDGSVFIGTDNGLNRLFPGSGRIHTYNGKNGFSGIMANINAVSRGPGGIIWFGTAAGVVRLDPSKLPVKDPVPDPRILGLKVKDKPYPMREGMKLRYGQRWIYFEYYSISLENQDAVKYMVKLEGADTDWRITSQTFIDYSSRPPGKYRFMVKATNSRGVWNDEPASFSFIIRPPFYRTAWFMLIVLALIAVWIVIYIKRREQKLIREKKLLEEKVEERTAEVVQKSMEIEEKNRDITASIRYAERIQRAMLPRENTFKETFVLFMPKDIVSGDFYWMYDNGDWQFIAAADCTGHGVPGAFMSIIGHNSLNKIVREYGLTRPSAIIDQLNIEVMKSLLQRHEKAVTDGMDIALIAFNRKNYTLEFAGAYSPLYVVRNGEVTVYKGDRFPIGMTALDEKKNFTNQVIDIRPGDMLYMCSDGYADQFGSEEGKKYKSGNVKKLLAEIYDLPICVQKDRLEKEILDWKGIRPQVDDILFIGTKIPEI
nr:SpoIIE family protein phosphatase [Bacteroidales bacterium]